MLLYKFCILVMKSLGRNKVRTTLTGLGIAVLVCVYAIVTSVTSVVADKINGQGSQTRLICTDRWVAPSLVPPRYIPDLSTQEGVEDWTTWNMFACAFDNSGQADRRGIAIATRPDNIDSMITDGDKMSPETLKRFKQRKDGAVVAPGILKMMNWHVGQQITIYGMHFPKTTVPLTIVGELPPGQLAGMYFRQDYLQILEPMRVIVNCVVLRVRDADEADKVATAVTERYARRQPALKVETESAGVARMAGRAKSILDLIELVVWVLLFDMIIILSNSISISVRERRVEMAVLKVLGFQPMHILAMVILEAMFIGAVAGLVGTGVVYVISQLTVTGQLPVNMATRFLVQFPVPFTVIRQGLILGAIVGFTGSFFPALSARKVKVSDVFARIS